MNPDQSSANREWWAQRWIDLLESFGWARRLERARIYAREGRILSLNFDDAKVFALVQGTAPEPYEVTLNLEPFSDEQWQYVVESMADRAIFSAKLLAGEMPANIEEVFTENGLSLFPLTKFDIQSDCNCPDPVNPCKHIGAIYYSLGDRFSQDPFVLFQLRHRTKAKILEALRQQRQAVGTVSNNRPQVETAPAAKKSLDADRGADRGADRFWEYDAPLDPTLVVITPTAMSETIIDSLGNIPGETDESIITALKAIYTTTSLAAAAMAMRSSQES
jgi:uncharacterized Zn finger protein